mmetsp:Transcript_11922/g.17805  ORF Transcript_11922/g.17805 Transcript_11922/m.17805 type:complete len:439 (+) Transcript_11922:142-1458(+)
MSFSPSSFKIRRNVSTATTYSRSPRLRPNQSTASDISLSSSFRRGALNTTESDAPSTPGTRRSISGRLGYRGGGSNASTSLPLPQEISAETTLLMPPSPGLTIYSIDSYGDEEESSGSPPLAVWIIPALSCAASYAFYNIFIKIGSASIHPILGGVILQLVAALFGTGLLIALLVSGDKTFELHYDKDGIYYSCLAGLAVSVAEMLSFVVSGLGVPATQSIPVIIGGSVLFGAVLGLIMLRETLMLHGWTGVGMLITGIACVALDPGEKIDEGGDGSTIEVEGQPPIYWLIIALICAMAYALYNIFIKKGSASINPILGGVILQFVAAAFGILLLGCIIAKDRGTSNLNYDRLGLIWSCMAGIAVGTAEMLSFCVSGMGVPVTQTIPVIIGGSVLFGAVLGLLMLGETLMLNGWSGIVLLTIGITIVATDPGETVSGH